MPRIYDAVLRAGARCHHPSDGSPEEESACASDATAVFVSV
jgi:hypothetical protein